jgi:hypothetical protein
MLPTNVLTIPLFHPHGMKLLPLPIVLQFS